MKRIFLIFVLFTSLIVSAKSSKLTQAIDSLDRALDYRHALIENRQRQIDSLKNLYINNEITASSSYETIANAYRGLNADSAIAYYYKAWTRAEAENNYDQRNRILLDYASELSKVAMVKDALEIFDSIPYISLPPREKIHFLSSRGQILLDASKFYPIEHQRGQFRKDAITDLEKLVLLYPDESIAQRITQAQIYLLKGNDDMAGAELAEAIEKTNPESPAYAIACSMLASIYRSRPDRYDEYIYYLTRAATADIGNANGEQTSLMWLGSELFKNGDINRAFKYLSVATDALKESGTGLFLVSLTPPFSDFTQTMQKREKNRNLWIIIISVIMILSTSTTLYLLFRIRKKAKSSEQENRILNDSITSRDQYINQLLELCSVYVDGLEDFNRLVGRKLKVNQGQDLLKLIESGKLIQDQTEKFFKVFDSAILTMYPNFIGEVNSLLQPEKQIPTPATGALNPELRIIAFMRLGITDSNRLSKFLGLSLNTVYTYRNRTKGRATNRDTFESDILKIGQ